MQNYCNIIAAKEHLGLEAVTGTTVFTWHMCSQLRNVEYATPDLRHSLRCAIGVDKFPLSYSIDKVN